jgi:energy-coupling factor transport system permease protein
MTLLAPVASDAHAPLARANPLAKLAAALVLLVALFVSLDGVTAGVVLLGLVAVLPFSGLRVGALARRLWPIGLAALGVVLANALFAAAQAGPTLVAIGPVRVGAGTALDAIGLGVRVVAIAVAGVLATATSPPTAVADALIQRGRVSPRFALGALGALRLVPLLGEEWVTIGLARRARGVDGGRSPVRALRLWAGRVITLLVRAVRRGSRLSLAMEARGLGSLPCRTDARESHVRLGDLAWILGALLLGCAALAVSLVLGTWRPLVG